MWQNLRSQQSRIVLFYQYCAANTALALGIIQTYGENVLDCSTSALFRPNQSIK